MVNDAESTVSVEFTPTIPHCSMATLIGLSIKVKLLRSLPDRFKRVVDNEAYNDYNNYIISQEYNQKEI
ncbi:hypothetical protein DUI87_13962 [Hirundo rustica rustica]|uniref:Uncharacterized protein n=1 Tax=Hirundo rustica rustica TaxID=333673 RepID=A0A3M0K6Y3_HIRRU|nr:hypothetical protein DUI87_13962 [Hirundo rustica rustica]